MLLLDVSVVREREELAGVAGREYGEGERGIGRCCGGATWVKALQTCLMLSIFYTLL